MRPQARGHQPVDDLPLAVDRDPSTRQCRQVDTGEARAFRGVGLPPAGRSVRRVERSVLCSSRPARIRRSTYSRERASSTTESISGCCSSERPERSTRRRSAGRADKAATGQRARIGHLGPSSRPDGLAPLRLLPDRLTTVPGLSPIVKQKNALLCIVRLDLPTRLRKSCPSLQIANVGKVSLRNIGLRSRVEWLDYWDGEPD
jgi:hypothetical protein